MQSKGLMLLAISIAAIMVCVGVGYATDYSATTTNTNNSLQATYMIVELNDNAVQQGQSVTANHAFIFTDLVYHRDMAVGSSGVESREYTNCTAVSQWVKVFIDHTPDDDTLETTMQVKLNEAHSECTITLQFYTDMDCTTSYEGPITLTSSNQTLVRKFITDTDYYCKATIVIPKATLDAVNDRTEILTNDGSGTINFGITFTVTANTTSS